MQIGIAEHNEKFRWSTSTRSHPSETLPPPAAHERMDGIVRLLSAAVWAKRVYGERVSGLEGGLRGVPHPAVLCSLPSQPIGHPQPFRHPLRDSQADLKQHLERRAWRCPYISGKPARPAASARGSLLSAGGAVVHTGAVAAAFRPTTGPWLCIHDRKCILAPFRLPALHQAGFRQCWPCMRTLPY